MHTCFKELDDEGIAAFISVNDNVPDDGNAII
jgi:hypothetical protein